MRDHYHAVDIANHEVARFNGYIADNNRNVEARHASTALTVDRLISRREDRNLQLSDPTDVPDQPIGYHSTPAALEASRAHQLSERGDLFGSLCRHYRYVAWPQC